MHLKHFPSLAVLVILAGLAVKGGVQGGKALATAIKKNKKAKQRNKLLKAQALETQKKQNKLNADIKKFEADKQKEKERKDAEEKSKFEDEKKKLKEEQQKLEEEKKKAQEKLNNPTPTGTKPSENLKDTETTSPKTKRKNPEETEEHSAETNPSKKLKQTETTSPETTKKNPQETEKHNTETTQVETRRKNEETTSNETQKPNTEKQSTETQGHTEKTPIETGPPATK